MLLELSVVSDDRIKHMSNSPTFTSIPFSYQRQEMGIWVLNTDDLPLDMTKVHDQQLVHLAPGAIGGNHKHPRTEWFIGIGDLELVWLDEKGVRQTHQLYPKQKLLLAEIPPFIPHAVRNLSSTDNALLYEYADKKQHDVIKVDIL